MAWRLTVHSLACRRDVVVTGGHSAPLSDLAAVLAPGIPTPQIVRLGRPDGHRSDLRLTLAEAGILDGESLDFVPNCPDRADAWSVARTSGPRSGWRLRLLSGPGEGRVVDVPEGNSTIGRDDRCDLRLDDADVSRIHCSLTVASDGLRVEDWSKNGTWIDGHRLERAVTVRPGAQIGLGSTVVLVEAAGGPGRIATRNTGDDRATTTGALVEGDGRGGLILNRSRSRREAPERLRFDLPAPPTAPEKRRLPWIAALAPLVLAGAMALFFRQTTFLLFALLSPLTMGANAWSDRRADTARGAVKAEEYRGKVEAVQARLRQATDEIVTWHVTGFPSGAECVQIATARSTRLWERSPEYPADFLWLRVGEGRQEVPVDVTTPGRGDSERPTAVLPIAIDLATAGVIGLAGPPDAAAGLARSVILQLATLHSDDDVRLSLFTSADEYDTWSFARWLPHTWDGESLRTRVVPDGGPTDDLIGEFGKLVADRRADRRSPLAGANGNLPLHVVVLTRAAQLRRRPDLAELLAHGPEVGVYAIALDADERSLPEECRRVAVLTPLPGAGAGWSVAVREAGRPICEGVADLIDPADTEAAARALAPLRRVGGDGIERRLPTTVRLTDLLGGIPTVDEVARLWAGQQPGERLEVPVGVGAGGTFTLDLVASGPHALLAGMSGSGKSELLKGWLASTAVHRSPTSVVMLLVEYKGASAFPQLSRLPHCVGTVTNLDEGAARRALTSLSVELKRRQRVLDAAGTKDIVDYSALQRRRSDLEPLPRLVVVVDEFAEVRKSLPSFIDGLVSVANTGRSLGVHLVLATQRLGGSVNADIAANSGLRISLRANSPDDSMTVLDSPVANGIPQDLVGRGYARRGEQSPEAFQAAHVAGVAGAPPRDALSVREWSATGVVGRPLSPSILPGDGRAPVVADDDAERRDIDLLVDVVLRTAKTTGHAPARKLFAPPLPELLSLDVLATPTTDSSWSHLPPPVIGLQDDIAGQQQAPYALPLNESHVAVVGAGRTGRTTTLRTTAVSWCQVLPADRLHVHVLDGARSLLSLSALPHAGTVVTADDPRATRLLTHLAADVGARLAHLEGIGLGDVHEQWRRRPDAPLPWTLLLIDHFESVLSLVDGTAAGSALERILSHGPAAGVTVLAAGDETLFRARWTNRFPLRIVHALNGSTDPGLPVRVSLAGLPPGRGYESDRGTEIQVAVLGRDAETSTQVEQVRQVASSAAAAPAALTDGAHRPWRLRELPPTVDAATLGAARRPGGIVLGVGGDDAAPVEIDGRSGGPLLIAGPPGSGRSTALRRVLAAVTGEGRQVLVVAAARSPLSSCSGPGTTVLAPAEADLQDWADRFADPDGPFVLVDDLAADEMPDSLTDALGVGLPRCGFAATTTLMPFLPQALGAIVRAGTTVLLGPTSRGAAAVYGFDLPDIAPYGGTPGRGVVLREGQPVAVQIGR